MSKEEAAGDDFEAILKNLRKVKSLVNDTHLICHQGVWVPDFALRNIVSSQRNFVARDDDIILTSCPKSGTTWLKALLFSIVNRNHFALKASPLLEANPRDLVPFLESPIFLTTEATIPQPRVLSTQMSYGILPPSVKTSTCKIVYICRNPMDQFISHWHFTSEINGEHKELNHLDECFDRFFRGIQEYVPFWDHNLGYWKASLERPHNILFLKYEDLKKDTTLNIRRLAEFLEEEKQGVIEEISTLCSIEKLKNLAVNKSGKVRRGISNRLFFRKGAVGDWKNFLTSSMVGRMEKLMKEKFGKHYLNFELSL